MDEARERLLEELRQVGGRYAEVAGELERQRRRLYSLIRQARSTGLSLREIGRESGLTFARIHQITRPAQTAAIHHPQG